ncbi:MAG TPA: DUF6491 family protein [Gammaproteobacteria bacterium]|nr:DUF6491 family protein [Gammaproteobacteria bacterium]
MTVKIKCCRQAIVAAGFGVYLALAGCATDSTSGGQAALERSSGGGSDCFFNAGVRDFTALDERNLILYGSGSRAYHLVLATPSFNLEGEWSIGVLDGGGIGGDGRICPFGGDRIIVDGPFVERISIRGIEAVDEAGVEALKVRFGKAEAASEELVTVTEIETDDEVETEDEADDD